MSHDLTLLTDARQANSLSFFLWLLPRLVLITCFIIKQRWTTKLRLLLHKLDSLELEFNSLLLPEAAPFFDWLSVDGLEFNFDVIFGSHLRKFFFLSLSLSRSPIRGSNSKPVRWLIKRFFAEILNWALPVVMNAAKRALIFQNENLNRSITFK